MSSGNFIGKIPALMEEAAAIAHANWEICAIIGLLAATFSIILSAKDEDKREHFRKKARQFRYCHDCPFNDDFTETCTINADVNEKCGLIDKTAGKRFTVKEAE